MDSEAETVQACKEEMHKCPSEEVRVGYSVGDVEVGQRSIEER